MKPEFYTAVLLWMGGFTLLYIAAKPAIAAAAGAYVTANALSFVPPAVQPLVDALGAETYSNLLGIAVQAALQRQLPL